MVQAIIDGSARDNAALSHARESRFHGVVSPAETSIAGSHQ
jgi:hypothetical protein